MVLCTLSLLAIITGGSACNLNTSKLGSHAEYLCLQVSREILLIITSKIKKAKVALACSPQEKQRRGRPSQSRS